MIGEFSLPNVGGLVRLVILRKNIILFVLCALDFFKIKSYFEM